MMKQLNITIKDDYINLDNLLKYSGIVSTGGEAKIIIKQEMVSLNQEICRERKKKVRKNDIVTVDLEDEKYQINIE